MDVALAIIRDLLYIGVVYEAVRFKRWSIALTAILLVFLATSSLFEPHQSVRNAILNITGMLVAYHLYRMARQ